MADGMAIHAYGEALAPLDFAAEAPPGGALVRVTGGGVCHSDVHIQDGKFDTGGEPLPMPPEYLPMVPGHEIEGVVEALGEGARTDVRVGDRVAVYPWLGCGECPVCASGEQQLCEGESRGLGVKLHGGYASHVSVPDAGALLGCGNLAPGVGGVAMCSGLTAWGALAHVELQDAPLLLVGLGGVGSQALALAPHAHHGPVWAADIDAGARERALASGAERAFDPADPAALEAIVAAGGAGTIIDFVGAPATLGFALGAAKRGGAIVVVGLFGGALPLPIPVLPLKSLTIKGSYVGSLDQARELMDLLRGGKVVTPPILERPRSEANAALDALRKGGVAGRYVLV